MRVSKLNLNLLLVLDALLNEKSISRAAEKVHLTQSATSNALARLRAYFEDDLLVQVGRRMELTGRAEHLKTPVRDILVRIEAAIAAPPSFDGQITDRVFRLLVSDYTALTLMPKILSLACQRAPRVRFELRPLTPNPARLIERGDADLLILPKEYCSAEHPTEFILEDTFCCVVWNESQLALGEWTFERFMQAGHIVVKPGNEYSHVDQWYAANIEVSRRVEVITFNFTSPPHLVVGTERIATIHNWLAVHASRSLPIAVRPIPSVARPRMDQFMQWHSQRGSDAGLHWLRALIRDAAANTGLGDVME